MLTNTFLATYFNTRKKYFPVFNKQQNNTLQQLAQKANMKCPYT